MNKPFYQCAVCGSNFETMAAMHSHEQEFHNPQEDREVSTESAGGPFPCPECGVELPTDGEVEEHLAVQHPSRLGMGRAPIQKGRGSKGSF